MIGPKAPPYGGMALQAEKLVRLLRQDGHTVVYLASNLPFPKTYRICRSGSAGSGLSCALLLIASRLRAELRRAEVVHVLAASWLYFFLVVAPTVVLARLSDKR